MNSDLFNILSQSKDIDQQKLLDYLQDKLSPEERHEIEKLLVDADFESDATEGLSSVKDKQQLPVIMNELNKQLVQKLSKRRKKSILKKPLPNILIPAVATIIILLLIMMFYLLLRKYL
ncbi:hypothetical protein DC498_01265 [Terrimonas sp.]|uniref:hypothetical protein n=1 Tax=Terrimonas sp. TaxID=1914338 RepID=UPI000D50DE0A|nr:hypothetical protein [Terrimonas sp.]PVD54050.1 hypothetical protein DC498_01265 [Terrimonas sp.]